MSQNPVELSDQDYADLEALGMDVSEPPTFHPILEVWREVLKPAAAEAKKKVTPQWASRIIASYTGVSFADMNQMRDRYFGKISQLAGILDFEIGTDPDCLSYATPEDDVAENSTHYQNLLLSWQQLFLQWELEWTCTDEHAAVELAAISEVHKMFFGETGLTQFLDNIRFEFTEDDQASLGEALAEQRDAFEAGEGQ